MILDVDSFLAAARALYPLLALAWLATLLRWRRPEWLLAGVVAAQAYTWAVTNYPLQRLYGLGPSRDRIGNVGLAQVVAAGDSPLQTTQVGQLHFEPFWGLLVAAVAGWNPERVLGLYPFLSLVVAVSFPIAVYYGLRPPGGGGEAWSGWERALAAGFAALLSSFPLDYAAPFRVPWARTFLLKPNHALGLVLFPLFLALFVRVRSWPRRVVAGLFLHLIGWVFVLHMIYVSAGLVVFALLSWLKATPLPPGGEGRVRGSLFDSAVVLGINFLAVSPYLVMLFVGYPMLVPLATYGTAAGSTHVLEATLASGVLFWLGCWGVATAYRRGDRLGRLWTAQILAAFAIWAAYLVLGALQLAREKDEIFYWLRFLVAASAGIGLWDLAGRGARAMAPRLDVPAVRAAAIALLAVPFSLPYWWDPARMDPNFAGSLTPVSETLRDAMTFLRQSTEPEAVVAGEPDLTRWAAALGARRSLIAGGMNASKDQPERWRALETLVKGEDAASARAAAAPYGVQYLLVDPGLLERYPPLRLGDLERRPYLRRVHLSGDPDGDFIAVFRLI